MFKYKLIFSLLVGGEEIAVNDIYDSQTKYQTFLANLDSDLKSPYLAKLHSSVKVILLSPLNSKTPGCNFILPNIKKTLLISLVGVKHMVL
jgi:hypothetical protein